MGTAILTNLNGMTNPPSDLNEITTGWKFLKFAIPSPKTGTFNLKAGVTLGTIQRPIKEYLAYKWPVNITGCAIMHKDNVNVTSTTGYADVIKPWPSNPLTSSIIDDSTYPLHVYFTPSKRIKLYEDVYNYTEYFSIRLVFYIDFRTDGVYHYIDCDQVNGSLSKDITVPSRGKSEISTYAWYLSA